MTLRAFGFDDTPDEAWEAAIDDAGDGPELDWLALRFAMLTGGVDLATPEA